MNDSSFGLKFLAALGVLFLIIFIGTFTYLLYDYTSEHSEKAEVAEENSEETEETEIDPEQNPEAYAMAQRIGSELQGFFSTNPTSAYDKIYRNSLVNLKGNGEDQVTVMVYMNGSNLETDYGFASTDIGEMLSADLSDQVSVVIQTMGTLEWQDYNIASDHTQRYLIDDHDLKLVDDSLGQEDCTAPDTLSDFIKWSSDNYPADRYFLILWNHGGGSVEGFGYNQWGHYSDSLTIDEMQTALEDAGILFDFIGMDSCIMSSIEVCYALYDYCDYMILSEDFESSLGWFYKRWLTELAANTSIDTLSLATMLIDDMVTANERDHSSGMASTLALIDQRYIPTLFEEWKNFAYANTDALLACNFSREVIRSGGRSLPERRKYNPYVKVDSELREYNITDMLAVVASINSSYTKTVTNLLNKAIAYYNYTENNAGLTGLSVTLPYGDSSFYRDQKTIYAACGIDAQYIEWLEQFTDVTDDPTETDYENDSEEIDWSNNSGFVGLDGL